MRFPEITNQILCERRNAYLYPAFSLRGKRSELEDVKLPSSFELDECLRKSLNSDECEQVVFGYLAVIFWGHASGMDGVDRRPRAYGKVRLAVQQAVRNEMSDQIIIEHLRDARETIRDGRISEAIKTLCELPQLQMAFASKVCAFIAPDLCGVIDSVIAENHPCLEFDLRRGYITSTKDNRARYEQYCLWLQQRMSELNKDAQFSLWTDRDGQKRRWRAIDVERALYADS